jgi:hypothetical protein
VFWEPSRTECCQPCTMTKQGFANTVMMPSRTRLHQFEGFRSRVSSFRLVYSGGSSSASRTMQMARMTACSRSFALTNAHTNYFVKLGGRAIAGTAYSRQSPQSFIPTAAKSPRSVSASLSDASTCRSSNRKLPALAHSGTYMLNLMRAIGPVEPWDAN